MEVATDVFCRSSLWSLRERSVSRTLTHNCRSNSLALEYLHQHQPLRPQQRVPPFHIKDCRVVSRRKLLSGRPGMWDHAPYYATSSDVGSTLASHSDRCPSVKVKLQAKVNCPTSSQCPQALYRLVTPNSHAATLVCHHLLRATTSVGSIQIQTLVPSLAPWPRHSAL